jgi:photosystem II stability/assembly factor-like uncharacterized protein
VVDPGDKSTLYLATQDFRGVLRSENGGESWDFYDHHGEIYGAIINALEFTQANNGTLIAGTANGKILTHSREGNTWEARYGLPKGSIKSLAAAPSDKKTIYAGTDRGVVIRSVDGGQLWTVLGQISNTFKVTNLAVHPDMPNYLYATTYGSGGNTLWSSQDSGLNWRQLSAIGLPRSGIHALSVDRNDPDTLFTGTSEGLFVSRDAGMHWEQMNLSAPLASIKAVAMHPVSPTPVYAASNASVFVNPEGDLCHWIRGKGLRAEELRTLIVDPVDPSRVYVGVRLLDEWSVFTSTDGGREWKQTAEPSIEPPVSDITALAAGKTPEGQTILYAGSLGCGIFRSDDRGENWETFGRVHCSDSGDSMPMEAHFLAVDASSPMHVYAAAGQAVYYSENGGQTWHRSQWVASQDPDSRVQTSIESPIVGLAADPLSSAVAYLVTRANGVWKTENGGASWRSLGYPWSDSMEPTVLTTRPEESGHLIVGSSNGEVWQSEDGGHHWKAIREDLAVGRITSIAANQSWEDKILIGSIQDGMAIYVPGELFSKADAKRSVQCSEVISTKP